MYSYIMGFSKTDISLCWLPASKLSISSWRMHDARYAATKPNRLGTAGGLWVVVGLTEIPGLTRVDGVHFFFASCR